MTIQDTYEWGKRKTVRYSVVLSGIFYFINFVFPRSRAWKTAKRY